MLSRVVSEQVACCFSFAHAPLFSLKPSVWGQMPTDHTFRNTLCCCDAISSHLPPSFFPQTVCAGKEPLGELEWPSSSVTPTLSPKIVTLGCLVNCFFQMSVPPTLSTSVPPFQMCAQYPLLAFLHYLLQTCLHHLFQLFVYISISRQLGTTCYSHSVTTCSWCIYTTLSWCVYTICSRRVHFTRFSTSATPGLSVLRAPSVSSPPSPALSNYPLCLKSMRSKKATSLLKGKKTKPFLFKVSITIPSPHQITR